MFKVAAVLDRESPLENRDVVHVLADDVPAAVAKGKEKLAEWHPEAGTIEVYSVWDKTESSRVPVWQQPALVG